jgi:hypothetical protein
MPRDDDTRKKANLRLALVLVSIVLVFFLGFFAKTLLLGR